jgi:hypothetical protein
MFRVAFGNDATAARYLKVSRYSVWRWRHDRAPLPKWVAEKMQNLAHNKVVEAHEAERQLRDFLSLPQKLPRKLSGCCAGLHRRVKKMPVTAADWATLGE